MVTAVEKRSRASATRPKKVREVYAELRRSLGDSTSSYEAIQLAWALVDLFDDGQNLFFVPDPLGRPSFGQFPLDKAFEDGGWRVLAHESGWVGELLDDEVHCPHRKKNLNSFTIGVAA